jgi:hypothetical protein
MQDQMQDRMDNKNSIKKKLERFAGGGGDVYRRRQSREGVGGTGPDGSVCPFRPRNPEAFEIEPWRGTY